MVTEKLLDRYGHGATAISISSECVKVILFGGKSELLESESADIAVLRFGRSYDI